MSLPLKCASCEIYFGNEKWNNLCSECYGITHPKLSIISAQLGMYDKYKMTSMTKRKFDCGICFEKRQLVRKFSCECKYEFCCDCLKDLQLCPTCRKSEYIELNYEDVILYTKNENKIFWFLKMISKYKKLAKGVITLETFFCTAKTYAKAMKYLKDKLNINFEEFNKNIYVAHKLLLFPMGSIYEELKKVGIIRSEGDCLDTHMFIDNKLYICRFPKYKDVKYEIGVDDE